MSEKLVEGLWDCPYCGCKQIGGLTKHCPQCGHPQDDGTKFYLGESIHYVEEQLAEQYGQGPDWVCEYCGSLNRHHYKFCSNCGSEKTDSKKDYFTSKEEKKDAGTEFVKQNYSEKKSGGIGRFIPIALMLLAMVLIFNTCFGNKKKDAYISDMSWTRNVTVETLQTVVEKDWAVPDGGRIISQSEEIKDYEEVIDHYETKEREISEQVYDHDEQSVSYTDNGDGTFTEHISTYPVYRTETRIETYEEPVKKKVPVYATEYTYEIEKWVADRTEGSRGTTDEPYWPSLRLDSDTERSVEGDAEYVITITVPDKKEDKVYTLKVSEAEFANLSMDDKLDVTIKGKEVTSFKKK